MLFASGLCFEPCAIHVRGEVLVLVSLLARADVRSAARGVAHRCAAKASACIAYGRYYRYLGRSVCVLGSMGLCLAYRRRRDYEEAVDAALELTWLDFEPHSFGIEAICRVLMLT